VAPLAELPLGTCYPLHLEPTAKAVAAERCCANCLGNARHKHLVVLAVCIAESEHGCLVDDDLKDGLGVGVVEEAEDVLQERRAGWRRLVTMIVPAVIEAAVARHD
jgi:hypothetical protein